MRKSLIAVLIVIVVAAGGAIYAVTQSKNDTKNNDTTSKMDGMSMDGQSTQPAQTTQSQNTAPVTSSSVTIRDYAYGPASVTVKKGTKVTWTNQDGVRHDVDSDDGKFKSSELLAKGESYSYTFDTVGTYTYHCSPHPYMKGTVAVTE